MPECAALRCYAHDHIIAPLPPKKCLFRIPCKYASKQLHMCLLCVCGVGCATANRHLRFKPADHHSFQFISHIYVSLSGETSSIIKISTCPHLYVSPRDSSEGVPGDWDTIPFCLELCVPYVNVPKGGYSWDH